MADQLFVYDETLINIAGKQVLTIESGDRVVSGLSDEEAQPFLDRHQLGTESRAPVKESTE
jgi:hypothetical protein